MSNPRGNHNTLKCQQASASFNWVHASEFRRIGRFHSPRNVSCYCKREGFPYTPEGKNNHDSNIHHCLRLLSILAIGQLSHLAAFAQTPTELKGHGGLVHNVAFSPDGKILATASFDNTIKLWDFASGKELLTLKGHTAPVYCVAFNNDGTILASGSRTIPSASGTPRTAK